MALSVEFETKHAAFDGDQLPEECARILEDIAGKIRQGASDGKIADVNGNYVGRWVLEVPDEEEASPFDEADEPCEECGMGGGEHGRDCLCRPDGE